MHSQLGGAGASAVPVDQRPLVQSMRLAEARELVRHWDARSEVAAARLPEAADPAARSRYESAEFVVGGLCKRCVEALSSGVNRAPPLPAAAAAAARAPALPASLLRPAARPDSSLAAAPRPGAHQSPPYLPVSPHLSPSLPLLRRAPGAPRPGRAAAGAVHARRRGDAHRVRRLRRRAAAAAFPDPLLLSAPPPNPTTAQPHHHRPPAPPPARCRHPHRHRGRRAGHRRADGAARGAGRAHPAAAARAHEGRAPGARPPALPAPGDYPDSGVLRVCERQASKSYSGMELGGPELTP